MPKVTNDADLARRVARAAISENSELYAVSDEYLAKKLGMSAQTYRRRLESPETFTLAELHTLSEVLRWTPVQMASVVKGKPITSKETKDFILM